MIKSEKLPLDVKRAVQADIIKQVPDSKKISVHSQMVDILSRVTPGMMNGSQEDINISKTIHYVESGKKPMLAQICKIKSNLCIGISISSIDWCFAREYWHRVYEQDGAKYHQFILPIEFRAQVMELFYDKQDHQLVEHTLQLVQEQFYWSTQLKDVQIELKHVSSLKLSRVLMLIQIHDRCQL